jgi:hypothetical protein
MELERGVLFCSEQCIYGMIAATKVVYTSSCLEHKVQAVLLLGVALPKVEWLHYNNKMKTTDPTLRIADPFGLGGLFSIDLIVELMLMPLLGTDHLMQY